jgi:tRNA-specific 2-thiouridylase
MTTVLVAMSGGVDSSVAAALLKRDGLDVVGVTMRIWNGEPVPEVRHHGCYGPSEDEDVEDARRVADRIGIPLHVIDLKQEYESSVLEYVRREYCLGRTPNPCVRCNPRIKFGALVKKAAEHGIRFDYMATGHYARVEFDSGRHLYLLKKAKDSRKDQSYFLFALSQEQLGRSLFPVGEYTKEEVRKKARELQLVTAAKPESQDFVAGGYCAPLKMAASPGPILDAKGVLLGRHRGIPFYTIGQRKGLGVQAKVPLYVTDIDTENNAIRVGPKVDLYEDELVASDLNWIAPRELREPTLVRARIRHNHTEADALVVPMDRDRVRVRFREPQMAIAPGQSVVFYKDETVVGGGTIESAAG